VTNHQIELVLAAAAAGRAFGPDVRRALRRILAAGVRLGAVELTRSSRSNRPGSMDQREDQR
jgi:hypothetical protein